jgi:hypothetical protein
MQTSAEFFKQIDSVEGWLEPTAAYLSSFLMHYQNTEGIKGDVAEIGVFKGKYFLTLATALNEGECAVAIDVFDDFSATVDAVGYKELGAKAESIRNGFEANTTRFLAPEMLRIIHGDSATLSATDVRQVGGPFRFFSVDGGHSRAAVRHDLALADSTMSDDGILSIDDFQNMQWPGVITAFFEYIDQANFVPFAIIPNKLLCSRPGSSSSYRDVLRSSGAPSLMRRDIELASSLVDLHANSMTFDQYSGLISSLGQG